MTLKGSVTAMQLIEAAAQIARTEGSYTARMLREFRNERAALNVDYRRRVQADGRDVANSAIYTARAMVHVIDQQLHTRLFEAAQQLYRDAAETADRADELIEQLKLRKLPGRPSPRQGMVLIADTEDQLIADVQMLTNAYTDLALMNAHDAEQLISSWKRAELPADRRAAAAHIDYRLTISRLYQRAADQLDSVLTKF